MSPRAVTGEETREQFYARMDRMAAEARRAVRDSWRAAHESRSIASSLNGNVLLCAPCVIPNPTDEDLELVAEADRGSARLRIATADDIRRHGCCHSCGADLSPLVEGIA